MVVRPAAASRRTSSALTAGHDGRLVLQTVTRPDLVDGHRPGKGPVGLDLRQGESHPAILTRDPGGEHLTAGLATR